MNRRLALLAWIVMSFFWVTVGQAASDNSTGGQQGGKECKTSNTPQAALTWQEQENARFENQRRAAAKRQMEINKGSANQDQTAK